MRQEEEEVIHKANTELTFVVTLPTILAQLCTPGQASTCSPMMKGKKSSQKLVPGSTKSS
jgi:hypothetical protein